MHLSNRTGLTQVEINSCWREALRHEKAHQSLNENFDFNPKNLYAVSQKPTQQKSNSEDTQEEMYQTQMLQSKLAETGKIPKMKFTVPMTSAQEIGWDMD